MHYLVVFLLAIGSLASNLDAYLSQATQLGRFNGVVLVAQNGSVVFRKAYGYADFRTHRPNTVNTQFDIASLTKMFTAFSILTLRDRGMLSLNDPICKYLAPCPPAWNAVTIDEVLHHRSGIPDYEDALDMESPAYMAFMTQPYIPQRVLAREEALPLDFAPGTKFKYSNTGYIVLATIVQHLANMPFGQFLDSTIFQPAGMTHTGFLSVDTPTDLAAPWREDFNWMQRLAGIDLSTIDPQQIPALPLAGAEGDAGVFSTVDDLYRWTQLTQGSGIVSPALSKEIFTAVAGYGMGWMIVPKDGEPRWMHTGELPGYLSNVTIFPQRHTTIVIMDNFDLNMRPIVNAVTAIALGKPYDMPVSGKMIALTPAQSQALIGAYHFSDGKTLCIKQDPDFLAASVKGQYTAGLLPLSATRFYMPLADGTVLFSLDGPNAQSVNLRYDATDHIATRTALTCPSSPS